MFQLSPKLAAIVAATAAAGLSGAAIAGAAADRSSTTKQCNAGRGHGMHADLAAIAQTLGVTEAKLRSALEAARPERPANGSRRDRHAEFAAAIAKALGEKTADVQAVLEDTHEAGGRRHGRGPGDESALVSALAERFSVTEAKAQAALDAARRAHEAEHEQREAAMYAAVAKALGKDAAAVEKAFEANRPARPTP